MDQILDKVMDMIENAMIKKGGRMDAVSKIKIKESLRKQFMNMPDEKRYEVLGLIMSQLGK